MRLGLVEAVRRDDPRRRRRGRAPRPAGPHLRALRAGSSQSRSPAMDPGAGGPRRPGDPRHGTPGRRRRIRPEVVMVSVAHDQDVILDGRRPRPLPRSPRRSSANPCAPQEVAALLRPLLGDLHETVRHLEGRSASCPRGRLASAVAALDDYLPRQANPRASCSTRSGRRSSNRGEGRRRHLRRPRPRAATAVEYASAWAPAPFIDVDPLRKGIAGIRAVLRGREDAPGRSGQVARPALRRDDEQESRTGARTMPWGKSVVGCGSRPR